MPRPDLDEVEAVEVLVQEGEQLEEVGRSTPQKFAAACPDAWSGLVTSRALPLPDVEGVVYLAQISCRYHAWRG